MHIHLPKPIHGWREFCNEVGIIVIGVLLALGAEQVVERLSWRAEVREASEDLHVELQDSLFTSTEWFSATHRADESSAPPETRNGRGAIKACSSCKSCPDSTSTLYAPVRGFSAVTSPGLRVTRASSPRYHGSQ